MNATANNEPRVIRPQPGPQITFLRTRADIAIYGGSAGGGKTWALLLEGLRHVSNPAFGAVTFRRTYPQIKNPGGLWDESNNLWPLVGAVPNGSDYLWKFPSGSKHKFAHLQHEANLQDWQGSQIALINWDELTHFTERMFFYMLSRNRSMCGVRPYVRATCNPDADSWVLKLIGWWIDPETGYAIPERSGVVRYFVRVNEELHFGDSREELAGRFTQVEPEDIKSLTFILARLKDNQKLLSKDPGYKANLMALPLVERERLLGDEDLGGNWKIRPAAGKVFDRDWFEMVDRADVPAGGEEVRFWDFAATSKKVAKHDPDFTAGWLIRFVAGTFFVMDAIAEQVGPAEVDELLKSTTVRDAERALLSGTRYRVRWEEEPGSASKRESYRLITDLLRGYDAAGDRVRGDKLTRARAFAAQARARNVKFVRGSWNERALHHLHHQPELPHDDEMDAGAGAVNSLTFDGGKVEHGTQSVW